MHSCSLCPELGEYETVIILDMNNCVAPKRITCMLQEFNQLRVTIECSSQPKPRHAAALKV